MPSGKVGAIGAGGASTTGVTGGAATGAAFFGAAFFAGAFMGAAFLTAAFFGAAFMGAAFLGAAFLGAAFFGAAFWAAFFGAAFLAAFFGAAFFAAFLTGFVAAFFAGFFLVAIMIYLEYVCSAVRVNLSYLNLCKNAHTLLGGYRNKRCPILSAIAFTGVGPLSGGTSSTPRSERYSSRDSICERACSRVASYAFQSISQTHSPLVCSPCPESFPHRNLDYLDAKFHSREGAIVPRVRDPAGFGKRCGAGNPARSQSSGRLNPLDSGPQAESLPRIAASRKQLQAIEDYRSGAMASSDRAGGSS